MTTDLPKPPLPADVDLHDFDYMPLDTARLWDSEFALLSNPRVFKAAVLLWCKAWHQTPASSLPDNDLILAKFAACDASEWAKIRDDALHGFVKCNDGRLYHSVIAEKAVEAWETRNKYRKAANKRWKNKRKLDNASHVEETEKKPNLCTEKAHVREGKGREGKEDPPMIPPKGESDKSRRGSRLPSDWDLDDELRLWTKQNCPSINIESEVERFRDYWLGRAGPGGLKADWPATWRNWARKAVEFTKSRDGPGAPVNFSVGEESLETMRAKYGTGA
jgi:uncharacterized protein YdaU (DUF1376 family)